MRHRLPLNALRAFEAAARHMSFSRAADELCVTPTAISHQIRTLEDLLEATLFERRGGRLALTAAAAAALGDLSDGFNKLESAMRPLSRRSAERRLIVAVPPAFASLWLLPRLRRFLGAVPTLDVTVATRLDPPRFGEAEFDVAICTASEVPGCKVDVLMREAILPVCAPHLLSDRPDRNRFALTTLPLIHDDEPNARSPDWPRYLDHAGLGARDAAAGLRFDQSSLATEAAIAGHGLLLGRTRLVARALATGRLAAVDVAGVSFEQTYYTVSRAEGGARPVTLFLDWLAAEARSDDLWASWSGSRADARPRVFPPRAAAACA